MKINKKIVASFILGFLISTLFLVSVVFATPDSGGKIGNPFDGDEKSWEMGTVITGWGYLYITRNEELPPHFYLRNMERVYVQYNVDGYYFVEKYYPCLEDPIYGWIWHENVLLDKDVVYE